VNFQELFSDLSDRTAIFLQDVWQVIKRSWKLDSLISFLFITCVLHLFTELNFEYIAIRLIYFCLIVYTIPLVIQYVRSYKLPKAGNTHLAELMKTLILSIFPFIFPFISSIFSLIFTWKRNVLILLSFITMCIFDFIYLKNRKNQRNLHDLWSPMRMKMGSTCGPIFIPDDSWHMRKRSIYDKLKTAIIILAISSVFLYCFIL